jgi:hypothetical protein
MSLGDDFDGHGWSALKTRVSIGADARLGSDQSDVTMYFKAASTALCGSLAFDSHCALISFWCPFSDRILLAFAELHFVQVL